MNNELFNHYLNRNFYIKNKLSINNNFSDYYFNSDETLNHNSFKSNVLISSDLQFSKIGITSPKVKFIFPIQIENSDKTINEESNSITFNYHNQFSDNRFWK